MTSRPDFVLGSFIPSESSEILEWIAYHKVIGATAVHLWLDDLVPQDVPFLDALHAAGVITLHRIVGDPEMQEESRNSAIRFAQVEAEMSGGYGLYLEPDEYFYIAGGAKTVPSLMRSCGGADVMSVPVQVMGTGGLLAHEPGPILGHKRAIAPVDPEGTAAGLDLRSVVRLGLFRGRRSDVPTGPVSTKVPVKWVSGSGTAMPDPHSRLVWDNRPGAVGLDKASILKIPAPTVETQILRIASIRPLQRPKIEDVGERLDELNALEVEGPSFEPWLTETAQEMEQMLALPGIREAYEARCAWESDRMHRLRNRPSGVAPLIAAAHGIEMPQPEPKAAKPAASATPLEEPDGSEQEAAQPILPDWFQEIHTGGQQQGFYNRMANHAAVCIRRSSDRLFVSFDNLSNVNDKSAAREPWAYKVARDNDCTHLSVFALRKDWYRDRELINYLRQLSMAGFFRHFRKVFMTGTSMGGFAALAFASLSPGATVISFNPQTTLDETLVPWERRFRMGRQRDWSLPHSDCAFEIDEVDKAFVLYDPFFEPDRKHVERLESDKIIRLKTWCSGHYSPTFLRRANILKPLMQHAIDGTLTEERFYEMYRERRRLPWYSRALVENLNDRGHPDLARLVTPAFRRLRREAAE